MTSRMTANKVYIEIVQKLREMIEEDGLKPGDKIPSERELSERLHVGRSSVREALRALELLGLIETRRGEGTFIREAHGNQFVQLLGAFILQDKKAKEDLVETKHYIEMDCLRLLLHRNNENGLRQLRKWIESGSFSDEEFFREIARLADNYLIYRIWMLLSDYCFFLKIPPIEKEKEEYLTLIDCLISQNESLALAEYHKLKR